jgi:hypothetical protein
MQNFTKLVKNAGIKQNYRIDVLEVLINIFYQNKLKKY